MKLHHARQVCLGVQLIPVPGSSPEDTGMDWQDVSSQDMPSTHWGIFSWDAVVPGRSRKLKGDKYFCIWFFHCWLWAHAVYLDKLLLWRIPWLLKDFRKGLSFLCKYWLLPLPLLEDSADFCKELFNSGFGQGQSQGALISLLALLVPKQGRKFLPLLS